MPKGAQAIGLRWVEQEGKGSEADMELNGSKRRQQMHLQHLLLLWQLLSLSNNYVAQSNAAKAA